MDWISNGLTSSEHVLFSVLYSNGAVEPIRLDYTEQKTTNVS